MKTVLVTGGSRGIGRATCELFGRNDWNVAIGYNRSVSRANDVARLINADYPHAACFRADIADREQVDKMIDEVLERFGHIDTLVNNAGITSYGLFQSEPIEEIEHVLDVNTLGMMNCTQSVLVDMLRQRSGCIVNVSSMWGVHGASCEVVYSATKAAVIGFTKALALELGPSGIRVNCVAPGAMNTDMMTGFSSEEVEAICEDTPLGRIGLPEDAAEAIFFLSSDNAKFITGEVLNVNGGLCT